MKYEYDDLVYGNVGNVVDCSGVDEDNVIKLIFGDSGIDSDLDVVGDVATFDFPEGGQLTLFKEDGYRGLVCYFGKYEVNGVTYYLDVVGEGTVSK